MGKKEKKRARIEEDVTEIVDEELQAEIEAVEEINKEKLSKESVNNNDINSNNNALAQSLQSIASTKLPFIETYVIDKLPLVVENDLDDLQREMSFYEQTLKAVEIGRKSLSKLSIPYKRPLDYFCEHVKSDAHMGKIKDDLILQSKKLEAFEKRKQQQLERKYNKSVSKVSKTKSKVDKIDSSNNNTDKTINKALGPPNNRNFDNKPVKSFKRKAMDKKYGPGGGGKRTKQNSASSLDDFKDYNPRGGQYVRRERPGAKGQSGAGRFSGKPNKGKPNRPGKLTRDKTRKSRPSK